jgi:tetratricopeptide (TPR) repeat protein
MKNFNLTPYNLLKIATLTLCLCLFTILVFAQKQENNAPRKKSPQEIAYEYYTTGNLLTKQKKYDDAINSYLEALKINENYVEAIFGIAQAKFLKIDLESSLQTYNEGIELTEKLIKDHETKANIKKILNENNAAKIETDEANRLKTILAEAYYQRGNLKSFLNDKSGGCQDIRKAKELGYLKIHEALKNICGEE